METEDEEMLGANVEDLEVFAGWFLVNYLDASCSIFFEVNHGKVALVEGHLWREIFLYCADEEKFLCLWDFDNVNMANNEEAVEDILVSF